MKLEGRHFGASSRKQLNTRKCASSLCILKKNRKKKCKPHKSDAKNKLSVCLCISVELLLSANAAMRLHIANNLREAHERASKVLCKKK